MAKRLAIGVDMGGTRVKAALVTDTGERTLEINQPSRIAEPYPAILEQVLQVITALKEASDSPVTNLGIGIAGLMDGARRRVIAAPNCPGVVGASLAEDLESKTGLSVTMDNDTNVMALGEGWVGAAAGCNHFIAVTLGTGVGGAVVSEGKILRGWSGGGGEIGHICLSRNGPKCGCGSRGCLEAFIGTRGITRWADAHTPFGRMHIKRIGELARTGDPNALRLFEYMGRTLGAALSSLVNLLNPEMIVVGGGIASAAPMLLDFAQDEVHKRAFQVYQEGLKILPAALGNWAGVVGAGIMALNE